MKKGCLAIYVGRGSCNRSIAFKAPRFFVSFFSNEKMKARLAKTRNHKRSYLLFTQKNEYMMPLIRNKNLKYLENQ